MKVELDEKGTLVVTSETPVESFALTHWYNLWEKHDATLLVTIIARGTDGGMDRDFTEVKSSH